MKKIEIGKPCIIKGSRWNDGRIVTPTEYLGEHNWIDVLSGENFRAPAWLVAEKLTKIGGDKGSKNEYACEARVMFPLDNPGDDEVDVLSLRKEKENQ